MNIFYIQKEGVYPQGVFWIDFNFQEGVEKLKQLHKSDSDNYHDWRLYQYNEHRESVDVYFGSENDILKAQIVDSKRSNKLNFIEEVSRKAHLSFFNEDL